MSLHFRWTATRSSIFALPLRYISTNPFTSRSSSFRGFATGDTLGNVNDDAPPHPNDSTPNALSSSRLPHNDNGSSPQQLSDDDSSQPISLEDPLQSSSRKVWLPLQWLSQPFSDPAREATRGLSKTQMRKRAKNTNVSEAEMPKWPTATATRPLLLTLDAFDTLFTPRLPVPTQYCEVAAEWGFELSEADVEASFRSAFKKLSKQYPNYGKTKGMAYRDWWSHIIRDTLLPLLPEAQRSAGVPDALTDKLYVRFASREGYELFQDVMRFLSVVGTAFQARRWPPRRTMLGVLSNSDPRVREILESFDIAIAPGMYPPRYAPHSRHSSHRFGPAGFAFATLSYECGHSKPSRLIFDAATRAAQAALDSMHYVGRLTRSGLSMLDDVRSEFHHMHVGDDVDKDILPALTCGWDAVLLDRSQEEQISTREIAGHQVTVINNLMALRAVVTKERLERQDGTPRQDPVWIDASRPIQRKRFTRTADLKGRKVVPHPQSPLRPSLEMIE